MGYDSSRFEGEVDEELFCSICHDVLENPLSGPEKCEHLFCKTCIEPWVINDPSCPMDRLKLVKKMLKPANRTIQNMVNKLHIRCQYQGCHEVVRLDGLQEHEQRCPNIIVQCEKCSLEVKGEKILSHDCIRELLSTVTNLQDLLSQKELEINNLIADHEQEIDKILEQRDINNDDIYEQEDINEDFIINKAEDDINEAEDNIINEQDDEINGEEDEEQDINEQITSFAEDNSEASVSRSEESCYADNNGYNNFTKVYIKNFGEHVTDNGLKELFHDFGEILSCYLPKKNGTLKSVGYGIIEFQNPNAARMAVDQLNGTSFMGHIIFVSKHQTKAELEAKTEKRLNNNLYVNNLDPRMDEPQLCKEFEKFGIVTSAKVMVDGNGQSQGYGFVCFDAHEDAIKAEKEMDGKILMSMVVQVRQNNKKEKARPNMHTHPSFVASGSNSNGFQFSRATHGRNELPRVDDEAHVSNRFNMLFSDACKR